jgi:hypothetical protein
VNFPGFIGAGLLSNGVNLKTQNPKHLALGLRAFASDPYANPNKPSLMKQRFYHEVSYKMTSEEKSKMLDFNFSEL